MIKGAIISECGNYRYQLWRIWDRNQAPCMFIMLNPSTADADIDDPTICRCIAFAKSWGYGGIYVGNLFAWRSTNPKALKTVEDPQGPDNRAHLMQMASRCNLYVTGWGNNAEGIECDSLKGFSMQDLHYLELNKSGHPKHPLYVKGDTEPQAFQIPMRRY